MRALPNPLHTRLLTLTLAREGPSEHAVVARVLDVRKRGVVPLAGLLNGPGVVHDMELRLTLGGDDLTIRSAALRMREVPFPKGPGTQGESCRDNEAAIGRVIGVALGGAAGPALFRAVGGPRGCFHVFTMLRLLAPSVVWAVRHGPARRGGRSFVRTIVVDGFDAEPVLRMRGTLTDMHYADGAPETLADSVEAEVDLDVAVPSLAVVSIEARHRSSTGPWSRDDVAPLVSASVARGYGLKVDEVVPATLAPLRQLLLMVQPTVFQCMPSIGSDPANMRRSRREGPGSAVDSCSMWRAGGPLLAAVEGTSGVRAD